MPGDDDLTPRQLDLRLLMDTSLPLLLSHIEHGGRDVFLAHSSAVNVNAEAVIQGITGLLPKLIGAWLQVDGQRH